MNMLEQLRADLKAAIAERSGHQQTFDDVIAGAEAEERTELTDDEAAKVTEARTAIKTVDERIGNLKTRIGDLEDDEQRKADIEALAKEIHPEVDRKPIVAVRREEPVYRKNGPHSFFADAWAVRSGNIDNSGATERLRRNFQEYAETHPESRAVTTGGFGGMVVPQYLTDEFAEVLHAGRVTANLVRSLPLPPEGMTLTIPRGTTGTLVAAQSDQNTALTSQDYVVSNLTINVNTYGGLQDVSRQAVERGTNVDEIIAQDLMAEYSTILDQAVINGAGTNGTHTGILNTTTVLSVTTGTATVSGTLSAIAHAIASVNTSRFLPPDVIIMHPRRWGFLTGSVDSNGRPLVVPANGTQSFNAFGSGNAPGYGFVGTVHGLPVYTDANIPTTLSTSTVTGSTEDRIIVARRNDVYLWEDSPAPRQFRFEEVLGNQLSVRLVAAGYSAFTAYRRPEGVCVISGSGMTTPTY